MTGGHHSVIDLFSIPTCLPRRQAVPKGEAVSMDDYEYHLFQEVRSNRMSRRDFLVRASIMGVGVPSIGAILAACGQGSATTSTSSTAAAGKPRRGGTANVAITKPASVVDPVTLYNQGGQTTAQIAGEYLCFPRADYSLDPRLAVSWTPTTPKEWTFKLRPGVKWHSGADFNADDVVYTMDLLTDPKVNSSALSAFKGILSHGNVEAVDPLTVKFHLDAPFVDFPYLVSSFNFNAIILPKGYKIGQFAKGHVGTGPFILTSYQPDQGAKYVRNPNYWDKRYPYLDGINLTYYDDNSTIALNMQGGKEQVWQVAPYQGSQALLDNPKLKVIKSSSSEYKGLHMRVDKAPFTSVDARTAVAQSLDRKAIVASVLGGYADVGNDHSFAPVFPLSEQALRSVPQRRQDYTAAKESLAKAGMPRGFSVTLTTEDYLEIPQYAVTIKQQCAKAGIDIKLNIQPQSTYFGSGSNQPWLDVPMGIVDWGARGVPSQAILPLYTSTGIWNSPHWKDAQFDQLFTQLNSTLDESSRLQIAAQMAQVQNTQVPEIIGYWLSNLRITAANINGLAEGPADHIDPRGLWISA
jgi:peptide/nickel transport system substrate-binding protein